MIITTGQPFGEILSHKQTAFMPSSDKNATRYMVKYRNRWYRVRQNFRRIESESESYYINVGRNTVQVRIKKD